MRWILILVSSSVFAQSPQLPQRSSAGRQWEAARKQAESAGAWLVPGRRIDPPNPAAFPDPVDAAKPAGPESNTSETPEKASCDALSEDSIAAIVDSAAKQQSVLPRLLHAVIEQESRFHPCAVSPKGAKGLMQLMPDTAAQFGVNDPFDPTENVQAGAQYLKQLLDKYKGDLPQALGAYNAGPTAVDQAGGIPNIKETRDYVQSIMQKVGTIPLDPPSIPMPKPIEN